jgi:integrase/recombinase XerD
MNERGCGEARMAGILHALRSLLKFCRDVLRVQALDPRLVRVPPIPRRDVVFLTKEEIADFLRAIFEPEESWQTVPLSRLCFRALVEVLLGTGARISEVLSFDRASVLMDRREAKIVGKGSKERTLFFTERSLEWVRRYLSRRRDDDPALFLKRSDPPGRLTYAAVKNSFQRAKRKAGLNKELTAHILRHTMATTLLFNGCPIGHIKVALGHERLDTTCRYYLGLDLRAAKEARQEFLKYD